MNNASRNSTFATKRRMLSIHRPRMDQSSSASWLVNGFPATIIIWTAEEWASLDVLPLDAQPFPNGIWCALRID
jgi:hypothetical protein